MADAKAIVSSGSKISASRCLAPVCVRSISALEIGRIDRPSARIFDRSALPTKPLAPSRTRRAVAFDGDSLIALGESMPAHPSPKLIENPEKLGAKWSHQRDDSRCEA